MAGAPRRVSAETQIQDPPCMKASQLKVVLWIFRSCRKESNYSCESL